MRDYPKKFSAGLVKRKNLPLYEEGGEVEDDEELLRQVETPIERLPKFDRSDLSMESMDADQSDFHLKKRESPGESDSPAEWNYSMREKGYSKDEAREGALKSTKGTNWEPDENYQGYKRGGTVRRKK
jgi:hypothetical protein